MDTWYCGRFRFPLRQRTYIMGIVNATPDSFGGDVRTGEAPLDRALRLADEGADILDIGGESTRPGAAKVTVEEEWARIGPLFEVLPGRLDIPISVDTTKAEIARRALECGAAIVNDISGATFDEAMLETVAASAAGLVLMHLRGTPGTMDWSRRVGQAPAGGDVIGEVLAFWLHRIQAAQAAGIVPERIAVDPGFGFGKDLEENLDLLRRGKELAALGYPVLSGTSRKSTIGKLLDNVPPEDRLWGTAAMVTLAIAGGADVVRVHDVKEMRQVVRVADGVVRGQAAG